MELRFTDLFTSFLGIGAIAEQFDARRAYVTPAPLLSKQTIEDLDCSPYFSLFAGSEHAGSRSAVALVKDHLAVIPEGWQTGGTAKPWLHIDSLDSTFDTCMGMLRHVPFISFDHDGFLNLIGKRAILDTIHGFDGIDAQHVHEAPVWIPSTSELIFADTAVTSWLWGLHIDTDTDSTTGKPRTHTRKIYTNPPLQNVNGGTTHKNRLYLTTNGGPDPAIWSCNLPNRTAAHDPTTHELRKETIPCQPVVNNYRLVPLNSPNDLIFTPAGNLLFTDPSYGWAQSWPGVGPPQLPTTIYHFNVQSGALTALSNNAVLQPNGLALSGNGRTLYVAESNSTSGKPIDVWEDSVRNVYAFEFEEVDEGGGRVRMDGKRLVHVMERGWPDGLRIMSWVDEKGRNREALMVAGMGGVDVVDVSGGDSERGGKGGWKGPGNLLGKWNVGEDVVFNLEGTEERNSKTWYLMGKKGVYQVGL